MESAKSFADIEVFANKLKIEKNLSQEKIIALAGNPNVGKSTVFNALTGLNQHTGNWPGKTVETAYGKFTYKQTQYMLIDAPGTYSLQANSPEEEIARDLICFGRPDVTVVVADATCLERNLNLVLQIIEITDRVVVCVNLMDEATKKGIDVDLDRLSLELGVPVVGTSARSQKGLDILLEKIHTVALKENTFHKKIFEYNKELEAAIKIIEQSVKQETCEKLNARWVSLKLLDPDESFKKTLASFLGFDIFENETIKNKIRQARQMLFDAGIGPENIRDVIVSDIVKTAERIFQMCVTHRSESCHAKDRRLDKIFTSKMTGIPVMLLLLGVIFWITIVGANYPSKLLSLGLFKIEDLLSSFFAYLGAPSWLESLLVSGVYRTLAWVVSVMLPPMAIFFPLFTLLEDSGYLPRIAFNMDTFFKKACAHGKQVLTMCMGFGCNACGVIGCRIIDSPRERLIAILTNNFMPCNGRFPTLIAIITMFFSGTSGLGLLQSGLSSLLLMLVIVIGVIATLLISRLLSKTILKGLRSSFALELPPYRRPQIGRVIVRSLLDRTLFVLGRAVLVAAPAGLVIWILSNVTVGGATLLTHCANFLDPFARLIGLDGVILMSFILSFPANELLIPIIIMCYMSTGSMMELSDLNQLLGLLKANGWTWITAICTMLFLLMHFPCGTTCLTIKKETQSLKWTLLAFAIPTVTGIAVCFVVANVSRLLMMLLPF